MLPFIIVWEGRNIFYPVLLWKGVTIFYTILIWEAAAIFYSILLCQWSGWGAIFFYTILIWNRWLTFFTPYLEEGLTSFTPLFGILEATVFYSILFWLGFLPSFNLSFFREGGYHFFYSTFLCEWGAAIFILSLLVTASTPFYSVLIYKGVTMFYFVLIGELISITMSLFEKGLPSFTQPFFVIWGLPSFHLSLFRRGSTILLLHPYFGEGGTIFYYLYSILICEGATIFYSLLIWEGGIIFYSILIWERSYYLLHSPCLGVVGCHLLLNRSLWCWGYHLLPYPYSLHLFLCLISANSAHSSRSEKKKKVN